MKQTYRKPRPNFTDTAIYKITVLGQLSSSWSNRLEGMNITHLACSEGLIETVLVGRVTDQAALTGVLNSLYELHFPVLNVNCLDSENKIVDRENSQ